MSSPGFLAVCEAIIDASGIAAVIEALLPAGVRPRQLLIRTLLTGMLLTLHDGRPAHLTRVHAALTSLPAADQARLGVLATWKTGPHLLTYRQVEHTFGLAVRALGKAVPDGAPSPGLQKACDALTGASIPAEHKTASTSLAVDWTDVEAWSRPVPAAAAGTSTDPEARWGHRNVVNAVQEGEMFFGYYGAGSTMVKDENGPDVPELARRLTMCSSAHDPAALLAGVLTDMPGAGIPLGDVLSDSGFSSRRPGTWAAPLRAAGAQLVCDLHPQDRGPRGTHQGAIIANGSLYCPATPPPLLTLAPLPPGAAAADAAAHDQQTAELARWKLGVHAAEDAEGRRRHTCPAVAGKIRCPLRPESMALRRDRPEVLSPPGQPQACCTQQTITAGPDVAEKTRQKHDCPSALWRMSYRRRTASERFNASIKNTATGSVDRGWIRVMGLTPLMLFMACMLVVRNQRILTGWQARLDEQARRGAQPTPPRRRAPAAAATGPP